MIGWRAIEPMAGPVRRDGYRGREGDDDEKGRTNRAHRFDKTPLGHERTSAHTHTDTDIEIFVNGL